MLSITVLAFPWDACCKKRFSHDLSSLFCGYQYLLCHASQTHFALSTPTRDVYGVVVGDDNHRATVHELMSEAGTLAHLSHRHIVRFYGVVEVSIPGWPVLVPKWIVMERASTSLMGYLRRGDGTRRILSPREYTTLLEHILMGLVYLHTLHPHALLHLDLKPANVLVFDDAGVIFKIGDVGCAKFLSTLGRLLRSDVRAAGTPLYNAPEIGTPDVTTKADVYSFAVMAAQILLENVELDGVPPPPDDVFVAYGPLAGPSAISDVQQRLLEDACNRPGLPPQLFSLLEGCGRVDRDDRLDSSEALALLQRGSSQHSSTGAPITERAAVRLCGQLATAAPEMLSATLTEVLDAVEVFLHQQSSRVLSACCSPLAASDATWACVVSAPLVARVVRVLLTGASTMPQDNSMQHVLAVLQRCLDRRSSEVTAAFVSGEHAGVAVVMKVIAKLSHLVEVVESGIGAMASLAACATRPAHTALLNGSCVPRCFAAVSVLGIHPKVTVVLCRFLWTLVSTDAPRWLTEVCYPDAVAWMKRAFKLSLDGDLMHCGMASAILRVLSTCAVMADRCSRETSTDPSEATGSAAMAVRSIALSCVEPSHVIAALRVFLAEPEVQRWGCDLLAEVAVGEGVASTVLHDIVDSARAALDMHGHVADVSMACWLCMQRVAVATSTPVQQLAGDTATDRTRRLSFVAASIRDGRLPVSLLCDLINQDVDGAALAVTEVHSAGEASRVALIPVACIVDAVRLMMHPTTDVGDDTIALLPSFCSAMLRVCTGVARGCAVVSAHGGVEAMCRAIELCSHRHDAAVASTAVQVVHAMCAASTGEGSFSAQFIVEQLYPRHADCGNIVSVFPGVSASSGETSDWSLQSEFMACVGGAVTAASRQGTLVAVVRHVLSDTAQRIGAALSSAPAAGDCSPPWETMLCASRDVLSALLDACTDSGAIDADTAAPIQLALCRSVSAVLSINSRRHRALADCAAARVRPIDMLPQLCSVIHSAAPGTMSASSHGVLAEALSALCSVVEYQRDADGDDAHIGSVLRSYRHLLHDVVSTVDALVTDVVATHDAAAMMVHCCTVLMAMSAEALCVADTSGAADVAAMSFDDVKRAASSLCSVLVRVGVAILDDAVRLSVRALHRWLLRCCDGSQDDGEAALARRECVTSLAAIVTLPLCQFMCSREQDHRLVQLACAAVASTIEHGDALLHGDECIAACRHVIGDGVAVDVCDETAVLLLANRARRAVDGGEVLSVESVQAAVACLAASMRRYFDKLAVVSTVRHALVSLCSPGASTAQQRATSAAVSTAECVASITHVMRAHISDAVIQTACSKLLMFVEPSRGIVRRVVAAAVAHADDVCVELLCIDVLLRCSRHDARLLSAVTCSDASTTPPLAVVMRSMRRASTLSDSSSVAQFASCVEVLRRTAECEPALIVSSGALQCLCQCTRAPMHSEAVHVDALACCSSAVDGGACSTDDLSGVLQWVSATLQAPWSDAAVPLACCASVASILRLCTSSSSGSAIAALCVQRGIECLRSIACAMLRFRHVAEMQTTALQLVSSWSSLSGGLEAVVHSGVLGAIVAMLDIHDIMGDPCSCGAATKLLATAMALSGTASAVLSPACVGRCVVTTMTALETHCNVVDVVDSCLTILLALLTATCDDTTETLCRSAPGLVVRALAAHSAVVDVHRRGMTALLELLRLHGRGSSSISDDDQALMVDCVRDSMRLHASDSDIAESGCSMVELWLTDGGHRVRLSSLVVNRGCVQSAVASMLQQPSRASLRQSVHRIVDAVVGFGGELAARAFSDIIAAASGSMESLPMQMDSVRFMSRTLGNTATSDRSGVCDSAGAPAAVDLCVKAGAIEWLLNTARRHERACELQLEMCGLISLLLTAGSGRSSAVDAADSDDSGSGWKPSDVLRCLSRALLVCKDAAGDAVGCLRSFLAAVRSVLPSHSPAVRSKWSEGLVACCYDEVLPSACAAMRSHASSVEVQQLCVDILFSLCTFCSACKRSARRVDSSCVEAIVACASAHMTAATVVSPALKCLRFLLGFRGNVIGVVAMSVVECSVASLSSALLDDETVDDDARRGVRCDAVWLLQRVCATAMSQTEWIPQRSSECIMALCGASRRCGVTAAVDADVDVDVESNPVRVSISLLHRLWQRGVASGDHADACRASIVHCCADGLEDEKDGRLFIRIVDVMDAVTVARDDDAATVDIDPDTATRAVRRIGQWLLAMSNKAAVLRSLRFSVSIMRLSLRLLRYVLRSTSCTAEARQRVFSSGIAEVALGQLSLCAADDGEVAAGMPDDCVISWSCECLVVMLSAGYTWGDGVALSGALSLLCGALTMAASSTSVSSCIAVMAAVLDSITDSSAAVASVATEVCSATRRYPSSAVVVLGVLRCLVHVDGRCAASVRRDARAVAVAALDRPDMRTNADVLRLGLRILANMPLRLDDGSTRIDEIASVVVMNEQLARAAAGVCHDLGSVAAELRCVGGVAAAVSLLLHDGVSLDETTELIAAIASVLSASAWLSHALPCDEAELLSVLAHTMRHNSARAAVAGDCCAAVASIASDTARGRKLVDGGIVDDIVTCMRSSAASVEVQQHGCAALRRLAAVPANVAAIVGGGAIDTALSALQCHEASRAVQVDGIGLLALLDAAVSTRVTVAAVLKAMRRHRDAEDVLESGCRALTSVSRSPSTAVADTQVVDVLPVAARHDASAQQSVCVALRDLASNDENRSAIMSAGGAEIVVSGMRRHTDAADVQGDSCVALRCLIKTSSDALAVARVGGIDAVVHAMRRHPDSVDVQGAGCAALWSLCEAVDNAPAVLHTGGLDVVATAMERHTAVIVQERGLQALCGLASSPPTHGAIAGSGGVLRVLSAMRHHADAAGVQSWGCSAACSLAIDSDCLAAFAGGGGVELVLTAMRRHVTAGDVQIPACDALRCLSSSTACRAAIDAAGGADAVATAMARHPRDDGVQQSGRRALQSLGKNNAAGSGDSGVRDHDIPRVDKATRGKARTIPLFDVRDLIMVSLCLIICLGLFAFALRISAA